MWPVISRWRSTGFFYARLPFPSNDWTHAMGASDTTTGTTRRTTLRLGVAGALAAPYFFQRTAFAADTIKVGVLFSLTGGLSIIEKSLSDATHDGDLARSTPRAA